MTSFETATVYVLPPEANSTPVAVSPELKLDFAKMILVAYVYAH